MAVTSIARPAHSALDATFEALDRAAALVDRYERGEDTTPPWGQCQEPLGEVRGALIMLEMPGAQRLVDECMALIEALDSNDALSDRHAIDALLYALLLLPRFIARTRSHGQEVPETLLPTINALRGLRRTVLIPEYAFAPVADLDPQLGALTGALPASSPLDAATLRRLRHMLQAGLLGLFNAPEATVHQRQVQRALARLAAACGDAPAGRWLELAARLTAAAQERRTPFNASMRLLIARMDFYIREVLLTEPPRPEQPPPPHVRQALLYYCGRADTPDALVERVREALALPHHLTPLERIAVERDAVAAPDQQVLDAVSRALGEEMEQVQSVIETVSRLSSVTGSERVELAEHLSRLGHTLTLLGLSAQAAAVKREHTRLQSLEEHTSGERLREILAQCVETLSASEDAVSHMARPDAAGTAEQQPPRLREASEQAIHEALGNLARVRRSLEYFNGDVDEGDDLPSTYAPLDEVRGTLAILGLERAAGILARARDALGTLSEADAGNSERLNALADSLAAIEWYMESLLEGIDGGDDTLDIADQGLAAVG